MPEMISQRGLLGARLTRNLDPHDDPRFNIDTWAVADHLLAIYGDGFTLDRIDDADLWTAIDDANPQPCLVETAHVTLIVGLMDSPTCCGAPSTDLDMMDGAYRRHPVAEYRLHRTAVSAPVRVLICGACRVIAGTP